MKAIGYIRVSTDQQAESGLGLEAQRKSVEACATNLSCVLEQVLCDEGMSGALALDKRPGMLAAIAALKKGDVLIVAKRDRLGRDPLVLAMIESAVLRKGARILSAAGEGTESNDPSNILMRRMVDAFGEYERLIIGARTKAALKTKKDKGERVGHIPYGYRLASDSIRLMEDEKEQQTLKKIHTMRNMKKSIRNIALDLNKMGFFNRGSEWNHASVHRMLATIELKISGKCLPVII